MKASVVIPSFNHAPFIVEAIESVLASDLDGLEIVLVDDGSTDDTLERLRAFEGNDAVRIYTQSNHGAHHAIGRGLSLARGEVLFILNSDDAYVPERIPRFVSLFEAEADLALLASHLSIVDAGGGCLGVKRGFENLPPWPQPRPGGALQDLDDPALALLQTNFISTTSNVAFRRSAVSEHGIELTPLRYTHDWDLILTLAAIGRVKLLPEPLVRYRIHSSNTIRESEDDREAEGLMRFEIMWTVVRHAPRIIYQACARGLSRADLEARALASLPRFGCEQLLTQLRVLRGADLEAPAAYDSLLCPDHPFRNQGIENLGQSTGGSR
jgi:glycosyltransferase involved in cell wall biosynthesis